MCNTETFLNSVSGNGIWSMGDGIGTLPPPLPRYPLDKIDFGLQVALIGDLPF